MQTLVQTPVTALIALAWVTLAFLTDPFDPTNEQLTAYGMLVPELVPREPWRLLTHAFLHGGIMHLLMNMLGLLSLGPALELSFGTGRFAALRFAILYVVASLGGGILCCLVYDPREMVVGGSGALFGMMGAAVAFGMRAGRSPLQFFEEEHGKRALGLIAVYIFAGFVFANVSNTGHLGGLLSGFAVTYWFMTPVRGGADRMLMLLRAGLAALLAGWLCYAVFPVARWDWLINAWGSSTDPQRRAALGEAAGRALGHSRLDEDVLALCLEQMRKRPR